MAFLILFIVQLLLIRFALAALAGGKQRQFASISAASIHGVVSETNARNAHEFAPTRVRRAHRDLVGLKLANDIPISRRKRSYLDRAAERALMHINSGHQVGRYVRAGKCGMPTYRISTGHIEFDRAPHRCVCYIVF